MIKTLFEIIFNARLTNKNQNGKSAANAITLLNKMKVSFSNLDLSNTYLEGADLENAIFHNTNL